MHSVDWIAEYYLIEDFLRARRTEISQASRINEESVLKNVKKPKPKIKKDVDFIHLTLFILNYLHIMILF